MPENAAELVEYLNSPADPAHPWAMKRKEWGHAAPYGVRWFELGNESMHGNHRVLPHRQYTAEQYAAYAKATAAAMRKVDPGLKIGIVTVPGAGNDVDSYWNRTVVRLAGQSADFLVVHMYAPQQLPLSTPENLRVQAMMAAPEQVREHLVEYHQMVRRELGHDLPVAITEFNGALDQAEERLGYADALECADLLRVFLRPETNVALANYWDFTSGLFGMVRRPEHSSNGEQDSVAPAFLFYQLWTQHFGSKLLHVDVQSPRMEFPGAGSEMAATGNAPEPRRQIQRADLQKYSSYASTLWPRLLNVQIQHDDSNVTVHLQNLNRSIYPVLARIPRPNNVSNSPVEFSVSFDARFTPAPGSAAAPMGIGLMDSRGWDATHSGVGLDDITSAWEHFDGTYRLEAQTPGVDLTARLMAGGKNTSGTLEVHNLTVTEFVSPHDAAYPLLTSAASTSVDGKRVYLVVLNKSVTSSMPAAIHLRGFAAAGAQYWQISDQDQRPSSATAEGKGAKLPLNSKGSADHIFPAHSMTAIEFSRLP
jgi:alpha-N-arabinofuranosidase